MYKVWQNNKKKKSSFNVFQQMPLARHCFWSIMSPVMSTFHAKGVIPYRQPTAVFDMDSWTRFCLRSKMSVESILGPSAVLKEGGVVI